MTKEYWSDYDKRPIGGSNPYWCCVGCGLSDPHINGDIKRHGAGCSEVAKKLAPPVVLLFQIHQYFQGDHRHWGIYDTNTGEMVSGGFSDYEDADDELAEWLDCFK